MLYTYSRMKLHWLLLLLFAITQIICAYANYTRFRYVISRKNSEKMASRLSFIQCCSFPSVLDFLDKSYFLIIFTINNKEAKRDMCIRMNDWVLCWDSAGEISSTDFYFIRKFSTINIYLTKASTKLELFSIFRMNGNPWKCATYSLQISDASFLFIPTTFNRFLSFGWIVVHRQLWIWVLGVTKTFTMDKVLGTLCFFIFLSTFSITLYYFTM